MTEVRTVEDEATLDPTTVSDHERARALSLADCLPLLASPDTQRALELARDRSSLVASQESFPIIEGLPVLFPASLQRFVGPSRLDVPDLTGEALSKYVHLSNIKFDREPRNSEHTDVNYYKHVHRARDLLRGARGTMLDVGCDSPAISRSLFPNTVDYIGLEPTYEDRSEFRIIGMAEFLPFRDASLDNVAVMTTLDHVLDHHSAIDEAWRVLKPNGTLYFASLVWTHNAQLYHDHIHFHHFRDFEILGVLKRFSIQELRRYTWKGDAHRFGWYLSATK